MEICKKNNNMHGFYLTVVSLLLVVAVLAYVISAEGKSAESEKLRIIFSWLVAVMALLLLVGVNVVCTYERPMVRVVYVILFLLILYNAFVDQFMDESLLTMSVPLKARIVGIIVVAFIAYIVARTRVWMNCSAHLEAIGSVYDRVLSSPSPLSSFVTSSQQPSFVELDPMMPPILPMPEQAPGAVVATVTSQTPLSREQKVDIMETIIKSMDLKPREISRMMTQKRRQKRRSSGGVQ